MIFQGYRSNETCILTQFPLRETIVDFWRMIWDYQLKSIVMLDDIESGDKVSLIHVCLFLVSLVNMMSRMSSLSTDINIGFVE